MNVSGFIISRNPDTPLLMVLAVATIIMYCILLKLHDLYVSYVKPLTIIIFRNGRTLTVRFKEIRRQRSIDVRRSIGQFILACRRDWKHTSKTEETSEDWKHSATTEL